MTQDRPALGIFLLFGFLILAPLGDAIAKIIGDRMALAQVVLMRMAFQALLLLPIVWLAGLNWRFGRAETLWVLARSLLHMFGIAVMFLSLRYLPIADAIAIAYVMPFIMLVLGRFFLDEEVGKRRIIACLVGFTGTLMVVQPSFAEVGWPAFLPLVVAVDFALFMMVTRKVAKSIDPISLQAVSGLIACAILLPAMLLLQPFQFQEVHFHNASFDVWKLVFGIGVLGTVAHLLMSWSLRYAPSTTLAPMQYLEIPIATVYGWLIFSDFPNGLALLRAVFPYSAHVHDDP